MKNLKLASKAQTLENLIPVIKSAKVLPVYRFLAVEFIENVQTILSEIQKRFHTNVVIRSSSSNEDSLEASHAGGYDSILDVDVGSLADIEKAIHSVINSYGSNITNCDEVFVQPMLTDVVMSGVIFSADLDTLSPYYTVNYDESGSTTSVTSGNTNELKTFISFKENTNIEDNRLGRLIIATKECEEIFSNQFLDIEFAFCEDELYILQVRPIVTANKENLANINLSSVLPKIYKKITKLNAPHPNLLGERTIFGIMPDWNPAEIIGIRPKRLALSLYKELITDETWAYQRDNYGYRNLQSHPLLVSFLDVPFIDARISFNSFIPKILDKTIAVKLSDHYLNKFAEHSNFHDKVEFEIVHSCYYFGIEAKLEGLKEDGFNGAEIKAIRSSLIALTNDVISIENGLCKQDLQKIEILKIKFDDIVLSDLPIIDKIYWLTKDSKRFGTLPFAGIARAGFISIQILKSLVDQNILTVVEYNEFLSSITTVSKNLSTDIEILTKANFLEVYGHLRPGTYDILSDRYDEAYDQYFDTATIKSDPETHKKVAGNYEFSNVQKSKINELIYESGLNTNFEDLIIFIKESIEGREYSKFVFTKSLSQILKYIENIGDRFNLSKEELAFVDIQTILNLYSSLDHREVKDIIEIDIIKNKKLYQYTKAVKLPSVIVEAKDIFSFYLDESDMNFVTLSKIRASVVPESNIPQTNIEGKIVCIMSADPGYDYLFSKNIGGLITCYGGANSHMAIRCAEMSIPAVIGCGEVNFAKYSRSKNIEIDAGNKQVSIL